MPLAIVQLCVQGGSSALVQQCAVYYSVMANDTCESIYASRLAPLEFFALNPGINCGNLIVGAEVRESAAKVQCSYSP